MSGILPRHSVHVRHCCPWVTKFSPADTQRLQGEARLDQVGIYQAEEVPSQARCHAIAHRKGLHMQRHVMQSHAWQFERRISSHTVISEQIIAQVQGRRCGGPHAE